jgi:putative ABC transport system permease protein
LFAALAAVGLGLGIGVNNTFFALTNAAVIRGLPIEDADRVMFVGSLDAQDRVRGLSHEEVRDLQERSTALAGVAAFTTAQATLTEESLPADAVTAVSISHNGLALLGRQPALGRAFAANDSGPGAPLVAILSDRLWETRYQRDPRILGRAISLDGRPAVLVGIMGPGFRFPGVSDLWVPLAAQAAGSVEARGARTLSAFGRLREGATRATAQADVRTIASQLNAEAPAGTAPLRTTVVPINEQMVGRVTDLVWLTFLTVGALVLLIACANVANLLLMRGAERSHELAIRTGLGATRGRLVRQLLVEGTVLASAGGVIGLGLSLLGIRVLSLLVPAEVPFLADLRMDGRVMAVLLLTSFGSILFFGLAPALHLSNLRPGDGLAAGGRTATRTRRRWWIATFLAVEFALTLVLACSVVLGMRFNQAARAAQYQFDTGPLFTASITLPPTTYASPEARNAFFDRVEANVAGINGVESVSIGSAIPGGGGSLRALTIAGRVPGSGTQPEVMTAIVGAEYFRTLGVALLRGRPSAATDSTSIEASVVVNQRFVDLHFPSEEPIGRLIRLGPAPGAPPDASETWLRIAGVSPTIRQQQQGPVQPDPVVYVPRSAQPPVSGVLLVRTHGAPAAIASAVRTQLRDMDPNLPLTRAMTLDEALQQVRWPGQVSNALLYGVGTSALVLALVGVYAVTAHTVRHRRREIGIRIAVGARPGDVLRLILVPTARIVALGLLAGTACTATFDRLFTTTELRLTDAAIMGPTLMAMAVVALAACAVPVFGATRVDPVSVLREE